jgi:hypothetical protein
MPKKARPLPPVDVLRAMFECDETGRLINRVSRTSRKKGAFADENTDRGRYRYVSVAGRLIYAHRVVWAIVHGYDPIDYVDHIDGDPLNNLPNNLRLCSHEENMRNTKLYASNKSGAKGVHLRADNGKWRAFITTSRKRIWLGQFNTMEEAKAIIEVARDSLHGEFARAA